MKDYRKKFAEAMNSLNEGQKKAASHIHGPMMVLAGPGTGKTTLLTTRIANLLMSDAQVNPSNILCMTFTVAGKVSMQTKLSELIGSELAYKVNIHTFHSFCFDIIQAFPTVFGDNFEAISDLEKVEIMKEIIYAIPSNSILYNAKNPDLDINRFKGFFESIKKENFDTEKLKNELEAYKKVFVNHPDDSPIIDEYDGFFYKRKYKEYKRGDVKQSGLDEIEKADKLIALIDLYPFYQEKMMERSLCDYNDMIMWMIDALKTKDWFRYEMKERFQYFMIDEFQDTNGSQFELINLLAEDPMDKNPNLFVVGDDDQSIYRFQGANMGNLLEFIKRYELSKNEIVVLTENYRSSQEILDASMSLIAKNQSRLTTVVEGLDKILVAKSKDVATLDIKPTIYSLGNEHHEKIFIANKIAALISSGVEPKNIAVLYPKNEFGVLLSEYLNLKKIDFYISKDLDMLQEFFAEKFINILRYLNLEKNDYNSGDGLLMELMMSDICQVPYADVNKSIIEYRRVKPKTSYKEYLVNLSKEKNLDSWQQEVVDFNLKMEKLIDDTRNKPLPVVVSKILTTFDINKYIFKNENSFLHIEILRKIMAMAEDFQKLYASSDSLNKFLSDIDTMLQNGIAIPIEKLMGRQNGVNLLTCHSSKGLEFEYVFIANSVEKEWEKNKGGGNFAIKIPSKVLERIIDTDLEEDSIEERRRLYYVAMTRAKKEVFMTYSTTKSDKDVLPSQFLVEVKEGANIDTQVLTIDSEEFKNIEWQRLLKYNELKIERAILEIAKERILNKSYSVTALGNYLKCPINFYYNNVLSVPGTSKYMNYGNIIHNTLEAYYHNAKEQGKHLGSEYLIDLYKDYFMKMGQFETKEESERWYELGLTDLIEFYSQNIENSTLNVKIENQYFGILSNDLKINGKLDKIEIDGNQITIIDYKTGKVDKSKFKKMEYEGGDLDTLNKYGNYWFQGLLYQILAKQQFEYKDKTIKVKFQSTELDKDGEFPSYELSYSNEDISMVEKVLKKAWEDINDLKFERGCEDPYCAWCDFHKQL